MALYSIESEQWLGDYARGLSDDEARGFIYNHMDTDLDMEILNMKWRSITLINSSI